MKFNKLYMVLIESDDIIQPDLFPELPIDTPIKSTPVKKLSLDRSLETADGKSSFSAANFFKTNAFITNLDGTEKRIPIIIPKAAAYAMKSMMDKGESKYMIYNYLLNHNVNKDFGYDVPPKLSDLKNEDIEHCEKCDKTLNKKFLRKENEYDVYTVNGDYIRTHNWVDFCLGGNGQVYKFIPKNELWIEERMDPEDYELTIFHEYTEANLIRDKGLSYEDAHEIAARKEKQKRGNESKPRSQVYAS